MPMNPTLPVRLLIVDDYPLVREGLAALLEQQQDLVVVAEAGSGREAIDRFRQHRPDVVLMDVRMRDIDGIEATRTLCKAYPDVNVVIHALSSASEDIYQAITAGAKAYVLKAGTSTELLETIRTVAAGGICIAPDIAALLAERMQWQELTPRERDVLACLADALNNQQIAQRLFITEGTVKAHINHILTKLHAQDRTGAVMTGLKRGLIHLGQQAPLQR